MGGSKVKQLSQTSGHRLGHEQGCEGLRQAMKSCRTLLCICLIVLSLSVWCELLSPLNTSAEVEAVFRACHREEVITGWTRHTLLFPAGLTAIYLSDVSEPRAPGLNGLCFLMCWEMAGNEGQAGPAGSWKLDPQSLCSR